MSAGHYGYPVLTRVDRSRDKYLNERHYGYAVLVLLSTCQPVKLSTRVDMSTVRRDGVFLCVVVVCVQKGFIFAFHPCLSSC